MRTASMMAPDELQAHLAQQATSAHAPSGPACPPRSLDVATGSLAVPGVVRGDFNVTIGMKGNRWRLLMGLLKPCDAITLTLKNAKMEVSAKPPENAADEPRPSNH